MIYAFVIYFQFFSDIFGAYKAFVCLVIIIIIIIIIRGNEKETCMLIDIAISGDRNVIKKEAEKILKYKDLTVWV